MPWWTITLLAWPLVAWFLAVRTGRFFGLNTPRHPVPPTRPKLRIIQTREHAGHLEFLPTRDGDN